MWLTGKDMEIGWIAMDGGWGWLHVQNGDFINLQILVTYLSGLRFSLANAFPALSGMPVVLVTGREDVWVGRSSKMAVGCLRMVGAIV